MQGMTTDEAKSWCKRKLIVTDEDELLYEHPGFKIEILVPSEHRRIVALGHDLISYPTESYFEGGLLWLQRWQIGVSELARPGWEICEDIRRAHGEIRSLELAPATFFRNDELVALHASLVQVMAFGWSAYLVPSVGEYHFELRESGKVICEFRSADDSRKMSDDLKDWSPSELSDG